MRLSRIIVSGFKTFARRSEIVLDDRITAIVGPNGSGKSNLVDAIRWALGETNTRELRGSRMDEVIYAGGSGRGRMGLAEVQLVLDNSEGRLPRDDAEVAISRRVERGGESELRLNRDRIRLRDLHRLLGPTGLTQHGYAVVAQQDIDAIIQASPAQRRSLVEQAAGVRSLRVAADDALDRIGRAETALHRLEDFLVEAEPRLAELEVQAEGAREQRRLAARLSELRGSLAREEWRAARARRNQARRRLEAARVRLEAAAEAESAFTAHLEAQRGILEDTRRRQRAAAEQLGSARLAAERAAGEVRRWSERRLLGAVQRASVSGQLHLAAGEVERARLLRDELRSESAGPDPELQEAERDAAAAREEHETARRALASAEADRVAADAALTEAITARAGAVSAQREAAARLSALDESLVSLEAEAEDVRRRLDAALSGEHGRPAPVAAAMGSRRLAGRRLRGCYRVRDPADAVALEAALEEHLHGWVTPDLPAAEALLDPAGAREELLAADLPALEGAVGDPVPGARPALSAIEVSVTGARGVLTHLLAGVWLVSDRPAAAAVAAEGGMAALPDGTLISRRAIRGGGPPGRERALAARPERERLVAVETARAQRLGSRSELQEAVAAAERERSAAEELFLRARDAAEEARRATLRLASEAEGTGRRLREAETGVAARRLAEQDRARRREAAGREVETATGRLEAIELRLTDIEGEVLAAIAHTLAARASERRAAGEVWSAEGAVERAAPSLVTAERAFAALEAERSEVAVARARAEDEHRAAAAEAAAAERAVAEQAEVMREEEAGEAPEPDAETVERAEREIIRLERRAAALGPVNALAPEQLEALEGRVTAVRASRDDLAGACRHVRELAAHLLREGERRFEAVFAEVSRHFQELFAELFPAGRATLRLAEPPEPPEPSERMAPPEPPESAQAPVAALPGVDIFAQPPGKRLQPLSLLSGGERALTALSVILALQHVNPSPVYVFDEVDAALDDANVSRLCRLLRRLCMTQQFIIVTHNHITMAAADALYGVTIDREGVSTVLSTRLSSGDGGSRTATAGAAREHVTAGV